MGVRYKFIRARVTKLLEECGIKSAPIDLDQIASKLGLQIKEERTGGDISGFLYRSGSTGIIGVNSKHNKPRRRFTAAHELGHYLLHSAQAGEVHVDPLNAIDIKFRDTKSSAGTDIEEREANRFAAELLMPEDLLSEDIKEFVLEDESGYALTSEKLIKMLANKYEVSETAMTFRLTNLGILKH